MPAKKNIYERLLEQGVPKQTLDKLLHLIILEQIKEKQLSQRKISSPSKQRHFKFLHWLKNFYKKILSAKH